MKILNSQGKIFNIINIIDLVIILLVVVVVMGGAYKLTNSSPVNSPNAYADEITLTVRYTTSDEGELAGLQKGDQLIANNSPQPIFIEDIVIRPEKTVLLKDDKLVESEHPFNKEMYITIRGEAYIDNANIHMANQTVRIGNTFYLKTLKTEFVSTISNIQM